MIYILTGPVRTGKTTALLRWASRKADADGVLCPDGADGKRYFLQLKTGLRYRLEAEEDSLAEAIVNVGRFRFLKSAFSETNAYLISAAETKNYTWLLLDELGKLELKNTGIHRAAQAVIKQHEGRDDLHCILVIRDTLLGDVLSHYSITQFQLITKEELDPDNS